MSREQHENKMYEPIAKFMPELVVSYHFPPVDSLSIRTATQLRIKFGSEFPEHDILTAFLTDSGVKRIYSVEVKYEGGIENLFSQAQKRSTYCDYCYIAVPLNKWLYGYFSRFLDQYKLHLYYNATFTIGFMIVDMDSGNVGVLHRAKLNRKLNADLKEKLFRAIWRKGRKQTDNYLQKNQVITTKQTLLNEKLPENQ
ncbi:MAG: hypothetical protein ACTSX0_02195 [Promethearchaeota archaeon]